MRVFGRFSLPFFFGERARVSREGAAGGAWTACLYALRRDRQLGTSLLQSYQDKLPTRNSLTLYSVNRFWRANPTTCHEDPEVVSWNL